MKAVKILALALSALMLVTVAAGCAKNEDENKTVKEVIEEPVKTPDGKDEDQIEYKEEFYFYNNETNEQYILGLTETEYSLVRVTSCEEYKSVLSRMNGKYTVDTEGNYILDGFVQKYGNFFFSEYWLDNSQVTTYTEPIVLKKNGDIYLNYDQSLALVKLGETENKFLWFGGYSENQLTLDQGAEKPESVEAYLVDGKTGMAEALELKADNFTRLDTSVVGEATATVTYENTEYTVSVNIKDANSIPPIKLTMNKYQNLKVSEGLPTFIASGSTYQEYFEKYSGTDPLFYYTRGSEKIAVTEYTVDGWDTENIANGEKIYYRVSAEIENLIYRYVGYVYVCDSADEIAGEISNIVYDNENIDKTYYGLWFVPKGHDIKGVKGDFYKLEEKLENEVELSVSEYDANKLGPQKIKLTYNGYSCEQMIYVYDSTNAIVSKTELVGLEQNEDGTAVDYSDGGIMFTYCDGTTRNVAIEGYKNSITESVGDDGSITVYFDYNAVVEGVGYPFRVTCVVAPNVTE